LRWVEMFVNVVLSWPPSWLITAIRSGELDAHLAQTKQAALKSR
jgi:hypothetical protein